jgi:hypothetical protein
MAKRKKDKWTNNDLQRHRLRIRRKRIRSLGSTSTTGGSCYCEVLISLDGSQELSTYTVRHMTVGNVKVGTVKSIIAVTKVVSFDY